MSEFSRPFYATEKVILQKSKVHNIGFLFYRKKPRWHLGYSFHQKTFLHSVHLSSHFVIFLKMTENFILHIPQNEKMCSFGRLKSWAGKRWQMTKIGDSSCCGVPQLSARFSFSVAHVLLRILKFSRMIRINFAGSFFDLVILIPEN